MNRDGATAEVLLHQRLFEDAEITAALADSGLRPISREPCCGDALAIHAPS